MITLYITGGGTVSIDWTEIEIGTLNEIRFTTVAVDPLVELRRRLRDTMQTAISQTLQELMPQILHPSNHPAHAHWLRFFARTAGAGLVATAAPRTTRLRRSQARACALDRRRWKRRRFLHALRNDA